MRRVDHLVIGGGMTASAALMALAERAPEARVAMLGAEPHLPYERPPLSKGLWEEDEPDLEAIEHDRDLFGAADLRLGREAVSLDPAAHEVRDDAGETWRYGTLLLATGARARRPPFGAGRVRTFRTRDDFAWLYARARPGARALVVGAGFIGSELAAGLLHRGVEVTLVFPEADVGATFLPPALAAALSARYRAAGVTVASGETIQRVEGTDVDGPHRVVTGSGRALEADVAVAGLGVEPDTALARAAGLEVDDGIVVDARMRTSAPDVFAAGDVARFPAPGLGLTRVEHEEHAKLQGWAAGENLAGADRPFDHLPMFYGAFLGLGYEAVGCLDPRLEIVLDGFGEAPNAAGVPDPSAPGVAYYQDAGRIRGVLIWNLAGRIDAARDLVRFGRRLGGEAGRNRLPLP